MRGVRFTVIGHRVTLMNYCLVMITLLLGVLVKLTGSGSACGTSWPLCPHLFREPNLQSMLEFSHRLSSALLGITVLSWLLISFRNSPWRWNGLNLALIGLLAAEAIIGKVIVRLGLPDAPLSDLKALVYIFHPAVSATLLFISGVIHVKTAEPEKSFKRQNLIFCALLLLATTGALNSLKLAEISAYSDSSHAFVISSYIQNPEKLIHPFLGFVAMVLAFRNIENKFFKVLCLSVFTGILIPLLKSKLIIFAHNLAFVWCVHLLIFSQDNKKD